MKFITKLQIAWKGNQVHTIAEIALFKLWYIDIISPIILVDQAAVTTAL